MAQQKSLMVARRACALTILVVLALAMVTRGAQAVPITITSSKAESGHAGFLTAPVNITSDALGFDFSGQTALASITNVALTFSMNDGDTAVGDLDHNDLYLKLDGLEPSSRWYLNGFRNGETDTVSFLRDITGDVSFATSLLGGLSDSRIVATIWDEDLNDNYIVVSGGTATLGLTGTSTSIPEPASMALLLMGLAGVGVVKYSRRRKA